MAHLVSLATAMTPNCKIILPSEKFRLEEINPPEELAAALVGRAVDAKALPEAPAGTLRLDLNDLPDGLPFLVGDDGILWTRIEGSSLRRSSCPSRKTVALLCRSAGGSCGKHADKLAPGWVPACGLSQ